MIKKISLLTLTFISFLFVGMLMPNVYAAEDEVDISLLVVKGNSQSKHDFSVTYGSVMSIGDLPILEGEEFAFYIHNGEKIIDPTTKFMMSGSTNLVIVIKPEGASVAAFVDTNGELLDVVYDPEELPSTDVVPTKPGYEFDSFNVLSFEEDSVYMAEYTLTSTTEFKVTINGVESQEVYNSVVSVTSDLENFSHW